MSVLYVHYDNARCFVGNDNDALYSSSNALTHGLALQQESGSVHSGVALEEGLKRRGGIFWMDTFKN